MPTLSVLGLKNHTRSADGTQVTVIFDTRYVGDLELTMSADSFDAAVASFAGTSMAPARDETAVPAMEEEKPTSNPNELSFTVPKTWLVAAELQKHGLVLVVFNHQSEGKAGYALSAEAATEMAAGLTKNAEIVANSKGSRPTAQKPSTPIT